VAAIIIFSVVNISIFRKEVNRKISKHCLSKNK